MERSSPQRPLHRRLGCAAAWLTFVACGLSAGCLNTPVAYSSKEAPAPGPVTEVAALWESSVVSTPDPVHQGRPVQGLAARLYLFSGDRAVQGDGDVQVDLYDVSHLKRGEQPRMMLERWNYDKNTLKRLLRRDGIAWGYTVFLPWGTYRPDISQVMLVVRYIPDNGEPVYAPSYTMTLNSAAAVKPIVRQTTGVPGPASSNPGAPSPLVPLDAGQSSGLGATRIPLPAGANSAFGNMAAPR